MASISCPQCGTPVDSRSPFCGYCGYSMKASEIATSRPPDGQQRGGYSSPDNQPPSLPIGNMPSLPTYPVSGSPSSHTHPASGSPSSFSFPANSSPPPPPTYPTSGSPSSFSFPTNSSPPPPSYQPDNNAFRFPSGAYPSNEANLPPQQLQQQPQIQPPPQRPRRGKKGMIAILVVAALVIVGGAVLAGVLYATHSPLLANVGSGSSTPTRSTIATQAPTATPAQNATATPIATTDTSTSTPTSSTPTAVTTSTSSSNYSATQPGPGCDTNGGTWTPQGISKITCGTQISVSSANARGYLYLQLPNNAAFASNNSIGISASLQGSTDCVGLAEQDANTGFLAEYCDGGNWYIYSITSGGATIKTLAQSITSTRTSEQLLLTLSGSILSFSIDSEVHKINISPINPAKVAITFVTAYYYGGTVPITNFSYTTQAS